VVYMQ